MSEEKLKMSLGKGMLLACIFIVAWVLMQPAHAQNYVTCSNNITDTDGDGWGWENNKSCKFSSSSNPKDAVIYVGFKVAWANQPLAIRHELEINRRDYGWQWLHTANVSDGVTEKSWRWAEVPNMSIQEGDSFCVRMRSTDGSTYTDYSPVVCERRPAQTIQAELYTPKAPVMTLY